MGLIVQEELDECFTAYGERIYVLQEVWGGGGENDRMGLGGDVGL